MKDSIQIYANHPAGGRLPEIFSENNYRKVRSFHESLDVYRPTPLAAMDCAAEQMCIKGMYVKDESKRFGLNAFKGLGASYAVDMVIRTCGEEHPVFVTATDGNHGRAVAWAADRAGCRSFVFMPEGSKEVRADAIRDMGDVTVEIMDRNYMGCVKHASEFADRNGYHLVQDTGFAGYEDIPNAITLGYTTLAAEIAEQMEAAGQMPTHVFLQAGVGSMAGGVLGWMKDHYGDECPTVSIVEAADSACCFESARQNRMVAIEGNTPTIMAGLNCGEPNIFTMPVLKDHASFFFKCADEITELGMRSLARPSGSDPAVVSGESGAVTYGLVRAVCEDPAFAEMKKALGINRDSVIAVISSEGDTDPDGYRRIVG